MLAQQAAGYWLENLAAARRSLARGVQIAPQDPGMWIALIALDVQFGRDSFDLYRNTARLVQLINSHDDKLSEAWCWYILGRGNDIANNVAGAERFYRRAVAADARMATWVPRKPSRPLTAHWPRIITWAVR